MNTLSVRLLYRPVKIGWCVSNGDFPALRKSFQYSFAMWGGRYNPIIPVDDVNLAKALVRLYRVDVLMKGSDTAQVASFINDHNGVYQQRAIILTQRELEPYFVYEETALEFDIERTAIGFEEMATVTRRVFFENRRRAAAPPI